MSPKLRNILASITPSALETYGKNLSKGERTAVQLRDAITTQQRAHQVDIARKSVNLLNSTRRKNGGKRKQMKRKTAKRRYKR
jgi:hypothetical protein